MLIRMLAQTLFEMVAELQAPPGLEKSRIESVLGISLALERDNPHWEHCAATPAEPPFLRVTFSQPRSPGAVQERRLSMALRPEDAFRLDDVERRYGLGVVADVRIGTPATGPVASMTYTLDACEVSFEYENATQRVRSVTLVTRAPTRP
jgi:hypothetical protein